MKMFFIIIIVSFGIAGFLVALGDRGPDKPSLITNKTCHNGEKLAYVAFRANKKSPWRRISRVYEGKAPTKKEMYQFALKAMGSFRFMTTFSGSEEEWKLMYDTIEKELSNK